MKNSLDLFYLILATTLLLNSYVGGYQKQDVEEFGGFMSLAQEGFMSAFATFMVSWIIAYTSMNSEN